MYNDAIVEVVKWLELAKGVAEEDALPGEPVDVGRACPAVAETAQSIVALLIGTDPKNIRSDISVRTSLRKCNISRQSETCCC